MDHMLWTALPYAILFLNITFCMYMWPKTTWRDVTIRVLQVPFLVLVSVVTPTLSKKLSLWLSEWYLGPCPSLLSDPFGWVRHQFLETRALELGSNLLPAPLLLFLTLLTYSLIQLFVRLAFFAGEGIWSVATQVPLIQRSISRTSQIWTNVFNWSRRSLKLLLSLLASLLVLLYAGLYVMAATAALVRKHR